MTTNETMSTTISQTTVVWDPVVRFGHWALVAAFAVAYFSGEEEAGGPGAWHVWSGYLVGTIVVLRVLWGFVGPRHARFSDFVCGPLEALVYLRDLLLGRARRRYLGHSPAGGAMVIALLVCLAATVVTGLVAYGEQGKGPLAGNWARLVSVEHSEGTKQSTGDPQKEGGERTESDIAELHDLLANITMALVVLHILGVAISQLCASGKPRPRDDQRKETPRT